MLEFDISMLFHLKTVFHLTSLHSALTTEEVTTRLLVIYDRSYFADSFDEYVNGKCAD